MSPYAEELAHARLEALRQLIDAMRAAEDPAEKRRCAVAIFNAPDPCEIDDAIELEDDDDNDDTGTDDSQNQRAPSVSERVKSPSPPASPIASHPPSSVPSAPSPATRASVGCQTRQRLEDDFAHLNPPSSLPAHEMGERPSNSRNALGAHLDNLDESPPDDDPDDPRLGLTDEQIIAKGAAILKALHSSLHSP